MLLAASFGQQAATMSTYKFTQCAVASPDAETFGAQKGTLWGCKLGESDPGAWQASQKAWYNWFTATCMHPQEHQNTRNVDLTTDGVGHPSEHRVGASQGTQAAGLGKIEEVCSQSQAGGCVPQWDPSTCGRSQQ